MKQIFALVIFLLCFKTNYCQTHLNRADSIISIQPKDISIKLNGISKNTDITLQLTVTHKGEVIQAVPILNDKTYSKEIIASSKKYAMKLLFDQRADNTPDQIVFVKISFTTVD